MGREIGSTEYTRSQRTRYRRELRRNLDLFETFLDTAEFVDEGTVGVELEMNLAQSDTMAPALISDLLLEDLRKAADQALPGPGQDPRGYRRVALDNMRNEL